jgi:hypothetical protein
MTVPATSRYLLWGLMITVLILTFSWLSPDRSTAPRPYADKLPFAEYKLCEPYTEPGILRLDSNYTSPVFETFDSSCRPAPVPWTVQIIQSASKKKQIPELQNKELLLIGDSVDRQIIENLCKHLGYSVDIHSYNNFQELLNSTDNGLPKSCYIPHLNVTLANWFLYGYSDDKTFWEKVSPKDHDSIGTYTQR